MDRLAILLFAVACGGGTARVGDTPSSSPSTTGTTTSDGTVTLTCDPTDNPQVFRCVAELSDPGPVEFSWGPSGRTTRTASSPDSTARHETLVWGIVSGDTIEVRATRGASEAMVQVSAGALPASLQSIAQTSGEASFDQVLVPLQCSGAPAVAMFDGDGQVVWAQTFPPAFDGLGVAGFHFTEVGTVASVIGGQFVFEHALDGTELRRFDRFDQFSQPLHHDVYGTADGRLYVLFAEEVQRPEGPRVLDGVYVFDQIGVETSWHESDVLVTDPTHIGGDFWSGAFPGADDYSHTNAVEVGPGGALVSLRYLDTVMHVQLDPQSADFGQVDWRLVGTADSPETSDFTLTSSVTSELSFVGQHNPTWTADGQLMLFDNRQYVTGQSRGLVFDLDEAGGTAEITEVYEMNRDCNSQGGAYELENGNRLYTCGSLLERTIYEFEPGSPDPVWELTVECPGWYALLNRAIPVEWDGVIGG